HQAVQDPRALGAMEPAELGNPQRQVAIRSLLGSVNESMPGTVHRLQRVALMPSVGARIDAGRAVALRVGRDEHILAEIFPMSRRIPQLVLEKLRRDD